MNLAQDIHRCVDKLCIAWRDSRFGRSVWRLTHAPGLQRTSPKRGEAAEGKFDFARQCSHQIEPRTVMPEMNVTEPDSRESLLTFTRSADRRDSRFGRLRLATNSPFVAVVKMFPGAVVIDRVNDCGAAKAVSTVEADH